MEDDKIYEMDHFLTFHFKQFFLLTPKSSAVSFTKRFYYITYIP